MSGFDVAAVAGLVLAALAAARAWWRTQLGAAERRGAERVAAASRAAAEKHARKVSAEDVAAARDELAAVERVEAEADQHRLEVEVDVLEAAQRFRARRGADHRAVARPAPWDADPADDESSL